MKKTFGISIALVGLLTVIAVGASTVAKPSGGNICSGPARADIGSNIGGKQAASGTVPTTPGLVNAATPSNKNPNSITMSPKETKITASSRTRHRRQEHLNRRSPT